MPTYFLSGRFKVKEGSVRDLGLNYHPSRIDCMDTADFHIVCIFTITDLLRCHLLPVRQAGKPYLCFVHINIDRWTLLAYLPFFKRTDVVFFGFDLGDYVLKSDGKFILSGVTVPSPCEYQGEQRRISASNPYLISFKGDCHRHGWFNCCGARKQLKQLAEHDKTGKYSYVYIDTRDAGVSRSKSEYMRLLYSSTYAFATHGDGRWSHRFTEIIGAGAIPVIIADALTLPFEQLINYDGACIRIPEKVVANATGMNDILDLLPQDPLQITAMMDRVKMIHDTCFKDKQTRVNMFLLSARHHYETRLSQ